ncbi:hypothetical protein [Candidatus Symbiobacter mobilis]|uniref:5-hmdU DNA kinase helical domain-containing protein n=1 Tax=Candidatus Symbiobacter mobilis CR TaxID=946483 RepID=U5NA89_9BURK|nr:hypothetical protein [Candidatus Symbiobacter mobilis]AGX88317.1 hypothetical protein Cenrod_2252 [Candidatus Symbiobacter mobilis CR]
MPDLNNFPQYFRKYSWDAKHALYGYPADKYDQFEWIASLERRFNWLRKNCEKGKTASIYLLKEMIQWGGSQNGTLQKFEDGIEQHNIQQLVLDTVSNLSSPEKAIEAALKFPGMGLTYASKMLRFLDPERYGALDRRIRKAFSERLPEVLPKIYDAYDQSMVTGYVAFTEYLDHLKQKLDKEIITRPKCNLPLGSGDSKWRAADIEMAIFCWAESDDL